MSTVVSFLGVSVTANSGAAGSAIGAILNQLNSAQASGQLDQEQPAVVPTISGGAGSCASNPIILPAPTGTGAVKLLVINPDQTGFISIPPGWTDVIYTGSGHLVGTFQGAVIGDLNANVTAPTVTAGEGPAGTHGTLNNLANHSVGGVIAMSFGLGNVIDFGDNETVILGNQTEASTSMIGSGSKLTIGDLSGTAPFSFGTGDFTTIYGNNDTVNVVPLYSQTMFVGTSGAATQPSGTMINFAAPTVASSNYFGLLINAGTATTVQASSGELTLQNVAGATLTYNGQISGGFDASYTAVFDAGAGSSFQTGNQFLLDNFGATGTDSVVAGDGANDSVFAYSPVMYDGTKAANSHLLFVNPTSASNSVIAGSNAVIWGGANGGGYFTIGSGSGSFFFGGAAGTGSVPSVDNIFQTASSESGFSAVVFSNSNEQVNLQLAPGQTSAPGALLVAEGDNTEINAMSSGGSNNFILFGQSNGTNAITQNATVVGSNTGHDVFYVEADSSTSAAHTFTIENFQQATDAVVVTDLTGTLSAQDQQTIADYNSGTLTDTNVTATSFTLSDGTTVQFTGSTAPHDIQHFP